MVVALTRERQGDERDPLTSTVIGLAIEVHRALGPGLLETVYEVVLSHELVKRGLKINKQVPIPIEYEGIKFNEGFRADIMVNNMIILELKSVEKVTAAH